MQRDDEPADRDQAHSDMISDIVDVSSEAFLGTTMGCAKCHDHKVDPIPQSDYYSLMSFFDSINTSHLQQPNRAWYDEADARAREESAKALAEAWATVDTSQLDEFVKISKSPKPMVKFGHEKGESPRNVLAAFAEEFRVTQNGPFLVMYLPSMNYLARLFRLQMQG
jgi:hypothetical protein